MKHCPKCDKDKELDKFSKDKSRKDGYSCWCKECVSNNSKIYRKSEKGKSTIDNYNQSEKGKQVQRNSSKKWYFSEKGQNFHKSEHRLKNQKEYRESEAGQIARKRFIESEEGQNKSKQYQYKFRQTEKSKLIIKKRDRKRIESGKLSEYQKRRRKEDFGFKFRSDLGSRINSILKGKNKSAHTLEFLGCSLEHLKQHLESQFTEGMTFENHGKIWDIDHIIPCSYFDLLNQENQYICFNYRNLQPLWCKENRHIKRAKVPGNVLEIIAEIKQHLKLIF